MDAAPTEKKRSRLVHLIRRVLKWTGFAAAFLFGVGIGTYFYFNRGLPSVEGLKTYRPPQVTKVFCGTALCAEFYRERRTWTDLKVLPPHVKNAFLAAEDADFY